MDRPTIDMWRALIAFRARHGRSWEQALSLQWMTGGEGDEPYAAALREARNQFGPSWLYRLKPATLEGQERRIARLDRPPLMCAALHPETGEPIVLKRGEMGHWQLPDGISLEAFNAASPPTAAQIAAMLAGSCFGWDARAADPAHYDCHGHLLLETTIRTVDEGGEGAG